MKAVVTLTNPEEKFSLEIDAWARLQFERNSIKHGVPPMPTREAAQRHPEMYMAICSYYSLRRAGAFSGTYDEFENRWGGIETDAEAAGAPEDLMDPTRPAQ